MKFWDKPARAAFLGIIFVELLSVFGWALPLFGNVAYITILLLIVVLSLKDLRYGVAIMLAELIIGSHGYLLAFMHGGLSVSLRIGLFLVVVAVALARVVTERKMLLYRSFIFWPLVGLLAVFLYAILRGAAMGNGFANVFFDANAFLYFGAALPFWQAIRRREDLGLILQVTFGALLASLTKVLFLTYFFAHELNFWYVVGDVYRWVRDTRIGELTEMTDLFFRVFFQSQIYTVIAWFVVLLLAVSVAAARPFSLLVRDRKWLSLIFLLILLTSSTLVSLSRSNWMGMVVAFVFMVALFFWLFARPAHLSLKAIWISAAAGISSLLLITLLVLFPFPPVSGNFSAGSLFSKRALTFADEAGVGSRWQLLPPLWSAITAHPILGQGFGKEVTYKTEDPRLLAQNPTGEYTTFIFEWGYHDLWLKLGLFGLAAYIYLITLILTRSYRWLSSRRGATLDTEFALTLGGLLSLVAVLVTHTFSPYLNHPLGIGYLLFFALFLEIMGKNEASPIDRTT